MPVAKQPILRRIMLSSRNRRLVAGKPLAATVITPVTRHPTEHPTSTMLSDADLHTQLKLLQQQHQALQADYRDL